MIMPALAVSVCVGRCGLGRADVVDALGWVGVAVDSELLAAGAAGLDVRALVPAYCTRRPADRLLPTHRQGTYVGSTG
jgi:hypothetical protein